MPQKIIDLDTVVPDDLTVRIDGEEYRLPGDIPVPDFLAISKAVDALDGAEQVGEAAALLEDLYEQVLELFRIKDPTVESLPIGPVRLGEFVIQLYGNAAEEDAPAARPTRRKTTGGTRSTRSRPKATRKSRS